MQQLLQDSITKLTQYENLNKMLFRPEAEKKLQEYISYLQENINTTYEFSAKEQDIFQKTIESIYDKKINCIGLLDIEFTVLKESKTKEETKEKVAEEITESQVEYRRALKGNTICDEMFLEAKEEDEEKNIKQFYQTFYNSNQDRLENYKYITLKIKGVTNPVKLELKGEYASYQEYVADIHQKIYKHEESNKNIMNTEMQIRKEEMLKNHMQEIMNKNKEELDELFYLNTLEKYHEIIIPNNTSYQNVKIDTQEIINQAENLFAIRELQQEERIQQEQTLKHKFCIRHDNIWHKYIFEMNFDKIRMSEQFKEMKNTDHKLIIKTCIKEAENTNEDLYFNINYNFDDDALQIRRSTKETSKFIAVY